MFQLKYLHRYLFVWVNSFAPFVWIALLSLFFDVQMAQEKGVENTPNEVVLNIVANGFLTTGLLSILGIFCWAIMYRDKESITGYLMPICSHVIVFLLLA